MTNTLFDYVPTPHLSDEQGMTLRVELWGLYADIATDRETKKKVRPGSQAERRPIAKLQAALLEATVPFEYFYEFEYWLGQNNCEALTHYHPLASMHELVHSVRRISKQAERIESRGDSYDKTQRRAMQIHLLRREAMVAALVTCNPDPAFKMFARVIARFLANSANCKPGSEPLCLSCNAKFTAHEMPNSFMAATSGVAGPPGGGECLITGIKSDDELLAAELGWLRRVWPDLQVAREGGTA